MRASVSGGLIYTRSELTKRAYVSIYAFEFAAIFLQKYNHFYSRLNMKNTSSVQAVIRYTFTETVVGGRRTTALIKAGIPKASEDLALVYLMQKYPERHNIEISEVTFYDH